MSQCNVVVTSRLKLKDFKRNFDNRLFVNEFSFSNREHTQMTSQRGMF